MVNTNWMGHNLPRNVPQQLRLSSRRVRAERAARRAEPLVDSPGFNIPLYFTAPSVVARGRWFQLCPVPLGLLRNAPLVAPCGGGRRRLLRVFASNAKGGSSRSANNILRRALQPARYAHRGFLRIPGRLGEAPEFCSGIFSPWRRAPPATTRVCFQCKGGLVSQCQ